MNRFNLTFRGQIIAGHDPAQAKARLAELLGTDDPVRLQQCFAGDPVVLERNLERKQAAELYARLRRAGLHTELVKVGERGDLHAGETIVPAVAAPAKTSPEPAAVPQKVPLPDPAPKPKTAVITAPGSARTKAVGNTEQPLPISRKADQLVAKTLQAEDDALLKGKENAIKKALRAKAREEIKRLKAAEKARKKAQAREAKEKAREQALSRRAEKAEKKRLAEQDAARRLARQKEDEARAAARRLEEQERRQAEEAAREAAAQAERERLEAERRALLAAQREEKAQKERARQAELQQQAAEKAARREREKRRAEQVAAQLQMEHARRKREQAEESARRRAEELRKRAEEEARIQAEQEEQRAQRQAMEEQAIERAAIELAQRPALKPVDARVKTRLETPSFKRKTSDTGDQGTRRQQPGAPNLYSLSPFRNTPDIRARSGQSKQAARRAFVAAGIALACALALAARLLSLPPPAGPGGAGGLAIAPAERLLLVADGQLLLHDRAGVSLSSHSLDSLGLAALHGPLVFNTEGELLAPGLLAGADNTDGGTLQLLRCRLEESRCEPFSPQLAGTTVSALALHPLDGSLFIADTSAGELLKVSAAGAVLARASAGLPARPVLRLDSGLLLMNSPLGAGLSVFRYEDDAFGKQLDEILLLPPTAGSAEFSGVRDFLLQGDQWWVLLEQTGGDRTGLYRFDRQWQFIDRPALAKGTRPTQLAAWGNRVLAADPSQVPVQRFSREGTAEASLVSSALAALVAGAEHRANLALLAWRLGLALCLLAAVTACCIGGLHRVRSLVYKSCHERGAEPIDEIAETIDWINTPDDRKSRLERAGMAYGALAAVLVLAAIGLEVSALQLSALLLFLVGPTAGLILLLRSEPGHIGICGEQLLLVDHDANYHLGGGSRIHYRGPFLMIDDVTVFTGTRLIPAFTPTEIDQRVSPIATGGVRVDRKIVAVKLLQGRHPLALGAVAMLACCAGAIALLSLQGIF